MCIRAAAPYNGPIQPGHYEVRSSPLTSASAGGERDEKRTGFSCGGRPRAGVYTGLICCADGEDKTAGDAGVGGVCAHCTLNQPFKIKDCKGTCGVCGCSKTNVQCIAWKDVKKST